MAEFVKVRKPSVAEERSPGLQAHSPIVGQGRLCYCGFSTLIGGN